MKIDTKIAHIDSILPMSPWRNIPEENRTVPGCGQSTTIVKNINIETNIEHIDVILSMSPWRNNPGGTRTVPGCGQFTKIV